MTKPTTIQHAQGGHVAAARTNRGWSRQDLADRAAAFGLGWTRATVWAIEEGKRDLTLVEAQFLARALCVEARSFMVAPEGDAIAIGPAKEPTTIPSAAWNRWVAGGEL